MTKPATPHPKPPASEKRPRARPRLLSAPTCLLDLPPPLMDALHRVAPKARFPKLGCVLAVVAGVASYVLYGAVADAVDPRVTHASPSAASTESASSVPIDSEQSVDGPVPASSATAVEDPSPPSASGSTMAAAPSRPKTPREPKRRTSR